MPDLVSFSPAARAGTGPTARVQRGVARNQSAVAELFPERALSATRSFRETEGEPLAIRRAKMLRRILDEHPVVVQEDEVIVGMKTRKPRGSPVFPEINCAWVERDLDRLAARTTRHSSSATRPSASCARRCSRYWRGRQIYDRIVEAVPAEQWRADERGILYHYFRSRTIGHFNAGYGKILSRGLSGIEGRRRASRWRRSTTRIPAYAQQRQFLESVAMVCDAVVAFAPRHAAEARRLAQPGRRSGPPGGAR